VFRVACQLILMVFNCLDNLDMEVLPILMGFKGESAASNINGTKDWHVEDLGSPSASSVMT